MAFSDARLIRTLEMRVVGRSTIVIEANDERRFEMRMIKDALRVQTLIRGISSHPTIRIDKESPAEMRAATAAPAPSALDAIQLVELSLSRSWEAEVQLSCLMGVYPPPSLKYPCQKHTA